MVVLADEARASCIADIPGLIEGAHQGAGLGDRFLGHVERCGILLHLVDGTADDPAAAYRTVRHELEAYGGGLAAKPELLALNKTDALDEEEIAAKTAALAEASGGEVITLSGATGSGVREALATLLTRIKAGRAVAAPEDDAPWEPLAKPAQAWRP